jgi:hypothetical protein
MKRFALYVVLSVLGLAATSGYAQTTVTGHVFAEVVESVSASTQTQSTFNIQRDQTSAIDFGQIEIKSAASASCSLILGKANLTSNFEQRIALETSASSTLSMQGNAINGYQSINLQYQPDENMLDQGASQYSGDINIVLAYN